MIRRASDKTRRNVAADGYSLLELMVTLALTSSMLTMTASWIAKSMRMNEQKSRFGQTLDSRWQLAEVFRNDVNRSRSASLMENQCLLEGPEINIAYRIEKTGIVRTENEIDQWFRIGGDGSARWDSDDNRFVQISVVSGATTWVCCGRMDRWKKLGWTTVEEPE